MYFSCCHYLICNLLLKGEHLTPLDYCAEENADLAELLRSFGGLTGTAAAEQRAAAEKERAEAAEKEATEEAEAIAEEQKEDGKSDGMCMYTFMCVF